MKALQKVNPFQKLIQKIITNSPVRRFVAKASHYWFFCIHFAHYIHYETALFQKEMFALTEDDSIKIVTITAFRNSGKSTIFSTSYPLWAILGKQQKKFVVIAAQTQQKAQQILLNIKRELEANDLLRRDLGPFQEERGQWGAQALYLKRFDAKIMIASVDQSVRGLRHNQYRPDLVILDDVEDLQSVKTREGREKLYQWFNGEVIPAGDRTTRYIIVGNLLHDDSLLKRLQAAIRDGQIEGTYREYPLLDVNGRPLWPGKFPTQAEIDAERKKIMSESAWKREYLLEIMPEEDQVIHRDWIQYYDELPNEESRYVRIGVDLAISESETADYSAIVCARVSGYADDMKICILPNPVNERLTFPQLFDRCKEIYKSFSAFNTKIFVEKVGYQDSLAQHLRTLAIDAEGIPLSGRNKRERLALISHAVQSGKVLFPRKGCERLIEQLLGFGREKHDDLVDALTLLVIEVLKDDYVEPRITVLGGGRDYDDDDDWGGRGWQEVRSVYDLFGGRR